MQHRLALEHSLQVTSFYRGSTSDLEGSRRLCKAGCGKAASSPRDHMGKWSPSFGHEGKGRGPRPEQVLNARKSGSQIAGNQERYVVGARSISPQAGASLTKACVGIPDTSHQPCLEVAPKSSKAQRAPCQQEAIGPSRPRDSSLERGNGLPERKVG